LKPELVTLGPFLGAICGPYKEQYLPQKLRGL
jgi:hypothetical protein